MRRVALPILAAAVLASTGVHGCGASEPRESDIYHDPALRPGTVDAASDAERQLLARLSEDEIASPLSLGGRSYAVAATYDAASDRRCREIRDGDEPRLACEEPDGSWVFVPNIVRPRSMPRGIAPAGSGTATPDQSAEPTR